VLITVKDTPTPKNVVVGVTGSDSHDLTGGTSAAPAPKPINHKGRR